MFTPMLKLVKKSIAKLQRYLRY